VARAPRTAKGDERKASPVDRRFGRVVDAFSGNPLVTREQTRGFGSGALKVDGKIFAMITSKGQFVVKLPSSRVDELIRSGRGERFEPRPGRAMKKWVSAPGQASWVALAREAYAFVKGG
jgi:hypothetical protein